MIDFLSRFFGSKTTAKQAAATPASSTRPAMLAPAPAAVKPPAFVRKYRQGMSTYELYRAPDVQAAKAFLNTKKVSEPLYYILVETPEGNWGVDTEGLYLEKLLPWQTQPGVAACEGSIHGMTWTQFGLSTCARGQTDNFVAIVECGKCHHTWQDGVRYRDMTVVRCPACKTMNRVSSDNIHVYLT
jgi:hypothetical protein